MKRDPNDIPFVSLLIDTGASAILSQDNDFVDSVRCFTVSTLGEMVGVYHRGLFSFSIMSDIVPTVIQLAGQFVMEIVKILCEFVVLIAIFVKAIFKGIVNSLSNIISKFPDGLVRTLAMVLAMVIPLILVDEKIRKKIISAFKPFWNKIKSIINKIITWLSKSIKILLNYLKKIGPYMQIPIAAILNLQKQIELLKKEIENIKLEDAVNYS